MAIGGFNGSDPSPTLAQFQQYVAEGKIHYLLGGSRPGPDGARGRSSASGEISAWVQANFPAQSVGGTTVYDLTSDEGASTEHRKRSALLLVHCAWFDGMTLDVPGRR